MCFIIIRADGRPLAMIEGQAILFDTEQSARGWLQPGERIEPAPAGIKGVPPLIDGS